MSAYFGFEAYKGEGEYVFISYSSKEVAKVAPYARYIHDNGFNVWYDYGIDDGEAWLKVVLDHLKAPKCKAVVLFVSQNSLDSPYVQLEVRTSYGIKKPIYGVFLESSVNMNYEMEAYLSPIQRTYVMNGGRQEDVLRGVRNVISGGSVIYGGTNKQLSNAAKVGIGSVGALLLILLIFFAARGMQSTPQTTGTVKENYDDYGYNDIIGNETTISNDSSGTYKSPACGFYDPSEFYSKNDHVLFGSYEQNNVGSDGKEAIEWRVLDVQPDKMLLITVYGLDRTAYHSSNSAVTWQNCMLRDWLNKDFYKKAFTSDEQSYIIETTLDNPSNSNFGTSGGGSTSDKVFCLSIAEVKKYFSDRKGDLEGHVIYEDRMATATEYAKSRGCFCDNKYDYCWCWLRSPGKDSKHAAFVNCPGEINDYQYDVGHDTGSVRPCIWVSR